MTQVAQARKGFSLPDSRAWRAALVVALVLACRTAPTMPPPARAGLWFEDLGAPLILEQSKGEPGALAARVLHRVSDLAPKPLPPRLAADREPRIVLVSISDGRRRARVAVGAARGVATAVDVAARALGNRDRVLPRWIKIDVVDAVDSARSMSWDDPLPDSLLAEPGLHGLAFEGWTGLAFAAEELVSLRLIEQKTGQMRRTRMAREATRRGLHSAPLFARGSQVRVRPFRAQSFFYAGNQVHALYRGHLRNPDISADSLRAAVGAGARYLARVVDDRGRFVYAYLAKSDHNKDDYNMVRHAGTIFAMMQAWQVLGEADILAAAERAIDHLVAHIEPFGSQSARLAVLAYGGKIKLGGVALAALALATHAQVTGQATHVPVAQRLCRYIRASQRKDGSFIHQRHHPGGAPRDFVSQYYPGEALLALVTMYRLDRDPVWLDTAEAGARYLIQVRDRGLSSSELVHDHWLLYALEGLYQYKPQALYLEHALRIARGIMDKQNRNPTTIDHVGTYSNPPRSTPVATRNEGLMAAYRLARAAGRTDMASAILETVMRGARAQLATQIDPARAMYLPDPRAALGGFTRSYTNFEVRIDYVQHNLSAFVALMAALEPAPAQ